MVQITVSDPHISRPNEVIEDYCKYKEFLKSQHTLDSNAVTGRMKRILYLEQYIRKHQSIMDTKDTFHRLSNINAFALIKYRDSSDEKEYFQEIDSVQLDGHPKKNSDSTSSVWTTGNNERLTDGMVSNEDGQNGTAKNLKTAKTGNQTKKKMPKESGKSVNQRMVTNVDAGVGSRKSKLSNTHTVVAKANHKNKRGAGKAKKLKRKKNTDAEKKNKMPKECAKSVNQSIATNVDAGAESKKSKLSNKRAVAAKANDKNERGTGKANKLERKKNTDTKKKNKMPKECAKSVNQSIATNVDAGAESKKSKLSNKRAVAAKANDKNVNNAGPHRKNKPSKYMKIIPKKTRKSRKQKIVIKADQHENMNANDGARSRRSKLGNKRIVVVKKDAGKTNTLHRKTETERKTQLTEKNSHKSGSQRNEAKRSNLKVNQNKRTHRSFSETEITLVQNLMVSHDRRKTNVCHPLVQNTDNSDQKKHEVNRKHCRNRGNETATDGNSEMDNNKNADNHKMKKTKRKVKLPSENKANDSHHNPKIVVALTKVIETLQVRRSGSSMQIAKDIVNGLRIMPESQMKSLLEQHLS